MIPSALQPYLPAEDGLLPFWLLLLSLAALGNSLQSYLTMSYTSRVYLGRKPTSSSASSPSKSKDIAMGSLSPATPLSSRTFGTWTALQSIVRFYAAYNMRDPNLYSLATWTFVIATGHFFSEWLVYGTARWGKGFAGPLVVCLLSGPWMWLQRGYYVR